MYPMITVTSKLFGYSHSTEIFPLIEDASLSFFNYYPISYTSWSMCNPIKTHIQSFVILLFLYLLNWCILLYILHLCCVHHYHHHTCTSSCSTSIITFRLDCVCVRYTLSSSIGLGYYHSIHTFKLFIVHTLYIIIIILLLLCCFEK